MDTNFYLGIDVSKGYADFCLLDSTKNLAGKQFQLYDIEESHQVLDQYLGKIIKEYNPKSIYAAVESTGGYENNWLNKVNSLGEKYPIMIARLNPLAVLRHRQANLKQQITDRTSSQAIAEYLFYHKDKVVYYRPEEFADLRLYLKHIALLDKHKVQLKNQLHHYLYLYFPEIVPYCRKNFPAYVLKLLENYQTSSDMAKARDGKRNKFPYFEDWKNLRERCKSSRVVVPDDLVKKMIADSAKQIYKLDCQIDEMYDLVYNRLPKERLDILTSMPGIGKKTAVILLCTIGDVSRFKTASQIISFFGLHPVIKESGDKKRKPYMSKRGNRMLRKHLYMAALVACRSNPYLKDLYRKSVDNGMNKKAAICKMMAKMMRMVYGMLTNNEHYNPKIDELYRKRYQQKILLEKSSQEGENNFSDSLLSIAPISKKNAKQRKEQKSAYTRTRSSNRLLSAPSKLPS